MKSLRWRFIVITVLTLWGLYNVAPSVIYFAAPKDVRNSTEEMEKRIPNWLPQQHVKLGLDLQGGVQLVLGVNTDDAVDNKLGRIGTEAQRWSDDNDGGVSKAYELKGKQTLRIELKDGADADDFRTKFKAEYPGFVQVGSSGNALDFQFDEEQVKRIKLGAIEQAEKVIRNRIDKWGVAEPIINRRQADNSVLVQLPGFKDPGKAKELLGRTAQLTLQLVDDKFVAFRGLTDLPAGITAGDNGGQPALISEDREALLAYAQPKIPADRQLYLEREEIAGGKKARFTTYVVEAAAEVGGDDILDSFVTESQTGLDRRPEVTMRFSGPGGKRFGDVTGANVGRRLAIILDDVVESAPVIEGKIPNGQAVIRMGTTGGYEQIFAESQELALILKSGALPATIQVLEERQVGASLGPELADQGIRGMLVGVVLVLGFMILYYRRPGVIACAALTLNALFLLALMAAFGFALTLPGIAGFVLTLGMAVDANILINERIRQELMEGKNAKKAVELGFDRVFWTIVDANVTTLIAALVLLETSSSGPIRGFAVTLIIGLLISLFTSLYCSRFAFDYILSKASDDRAVRKWLGDAKARVFTFDYLRVGKPLTIAATVLALSVLGVAATRGMNWGVDFAGGTEMQVRFGQDIEPNEISQAGAAVGIKSITMQSLGESGREYLLRFGAEDIEKVGGGPVTAADESIKVQEFKQAIETKLAAKQPEIRQIDYVGPQIGKELRNQGVISVFYAILGVLLYIGLRFDISFAPGAMYKMVQDLFIMLGFYVFFWRSFDLTAVAACLTIVGYSVNDTIVIYDRIRENLNSSARRSLYDTINTSLNETLGRSINTSVTVFLALVGMLIFSTGQLWNFAAAMAIGVVAATFSSTFVASSFILWFENYRAKRKKSTGGGTPAPTPAR
jgi:protein-export membrane protein SecD/preprotein translocase SecF subunit